MEESFDSYIGTAIWSSADNGSGVTDEHTIADFDEELLNAMRGMHDVFYQAFFGLVELDDGFYHNRDVSFGHNMWMTQNGHGAGFWDGDYVNGDKLTEACGAFLRPFELYVGDDYRIYGM